MKKEEKDKRSIFVKIRVTATELAQLRKLQKQTTENTLSNYLRKVGLQKPVIVKYRNATADDFLREMLPLKKELNAIGNNYNQAVKKLHILEKIPEFRSWLLIYESSRKVLIEKVAEITSRVAQLYEQWLQK
jgi:hypothetical protein